MRRALDSKKVKFEGCSELDRERWLGMGDIVLGFERGSPWVMTRPRIWPCKMVSEEEVVLGEEIK